MKDQIVNTTKELPGLKVLVEKELKKTSDPVQVEENIFNEYSWYYSRTRLKEEIERQTSKA